MPEKVPVTAVRNGGLDFLTVPTRQEILIAAFVRERAGYLQYGRIDDAALVTAELVKLGYEESDEEYTS
jgi:FixJ family two-component response regulator